MISCKTWYALCTGYRKAVPPEFRNQPEGADRPVYKKNLQNRLQLSYHDGAADRASEPA